MESEANKSLKVPSPDDDPILSPHLDEDVLRHIATFLDFQSLRQFRLVSREWNAAFLPILMKRGTYNLIHFSYGNEERADLVEGAKHYSSWKLTRTVYKSSGILQDNGMWENVRSLTIKTWIPLGRELLRWAWETIGSHCADVQELTVIFESFEDYYEVDCEVVSDYEQAIQGLPNPSFPNISRLNGICDEITAHFAQHLLQATTPSLRYLSFCPIRASYGYSLSEPFRIFEYLKQNPSLLKNLQSFSFKIRNDYGIVSNDGWFSIRDYEKQSQFAKFVKRNPSSLQLQFSENLETLLWDSSFHLHDQFLPGVLTPSIASSLVQLILNGKVENVEETADMDYSPSMDPWVNPIQMSFPNFPRLRVLKLGLFAFLSLSVPELVDSAPNLQVLEMKARSIMLKKTTLYWRASRPATYSNPRHTQLRIFSTDISFQGLSTLQTISTKFPNLVELRLGVVWYVGLDTFLDFVKSNHPNLQRLRWNSCLTKIKLIVAEIFYHLIRVREQLPNLTSYSLGNQIGVHETRCYSSDDNMYKSANRLLNFFSSSNDPSSCLLINLRPDFVSCKCKDYEERVWDGCMACSLRYFLKCHKHLPIRIQSEREISEMTKIKILEY
jgi:hypothetical protein